MTKLEEMAAGKLAAAVEKFINDYKHYGGLVSSLEEALAKWRMG